MIPPPIVIPQPIERTTSIRMPDQNLRGAPGMPKSSSASTAPPGSHPKPCVVRLSRAVAVAPVVAIVSVLVTAAVPFGVTDAGLKLQATPFGSVELSHWNETAWVKPFCGVTVKVTLPEAPCFTVSDAGLAEIVYDGVGGWKAAVVVRAA
jgi:hypothetical protein